MTSALLRSGMFGVAWIVEAERDDFVTSGDCPQLSVVAAVEEVRQQEDDRAAAVDAPDIRERPRDVAADVELLLLVERHLRQRRRG